MTTDVSLSRLYALRAGYALVSIGLAATIWPLVLHHPPGWPLMNGVACCLLAAVSVLAAVGIRYPLQMLPVLLFEIVWKAIWLCAVALPLWLAHQVDARTADTVRDCFFGIVLVPLVPWGYVLSQYVMRPGDRWRRRAPASTSGAREALVRYSGRETGVRDEGQPRPCRPAFVLSVPKMGSRCAQPKVPMRMCHVRPQEWSSPPAFRTRAFGGEIPQSFTRRPLDWHRPQDTTGPPSRGSHWCGNGSEGERMMIEANRAEQLMEQGYV